MEEGLNIKMNRFIILLVFLLSVLSGCVQKDATVMQPVRVLLAGGHGNTPCILEILPNGILEATVGDLTLGETDGNFDFSRIVKRKTKRLSKNDKRIIDNIITEVKVNCNAEDDSALQFNDAVVVYAVIDGVCYISLYDYQLNFNTNEELTRLAHKLVDISPIKVLEK